MSNELKYLVIPDNIETRKYVEESDIKYFEMAEQEFKRSLEETYRDKFRNRIKRGEAAQFIKNYVDVGWSLEKVYDFRKELGILQAAHPDKKYHIDHIIPYSFFAITTMYCNEKRIFKKLMHLSSHYKNIRIIDADGNHSKGKKIDDKSGCHAIATVLDSYCPGLVACFNEYVRLGQNKRKYINFLINSKFDLKINKFDDQFMDQFSYERIETHIKNTLPTHLPSKWSA